ncbi:hypothetical protein HY480_01600 [Candidatus Uhrbacteria bacterium]|nr:hypothetical protein [Candidatus Uhrbacteria bacterium]
MRNTFIVLCAAIVAATVGCGGDTETENACIAEHPRDGALNADNKQAASSTEARCAEAGDPCESDDFISREAAECVARKDGLAEGIAPWSAMVVYDGRFGPVWNIENTLEEQDDGCRGGELTKLDAITGKILLSSDEMGWRACP